MADFTRFFLRGLEALLPTLITLFVLAWLWNQLNDKLGRHIITGLRYAAKWVGYRFGDEPAGYVKVHVDGLFDRMPPWLVELIGVVLAIVLVYIVGLFVGNLIGRTVWRLAEMAVMRIPLVRAIYPAVKQVTDFLLADRRSGGSAGGQFAQSRVVAVQPHEQGIWSIGLITGEGLRALSDSVGEEMVTVFVPSSPTAFSGYVLVVPRRSVVELPLTVEEAMRVLISGGVISPSNTGSKTLPAGSPATTGATAAEELPAAGKWPRNAGGAALGTQQRTEHLDAQRRAAAPAPAQY